MASSANPGRRASPSRRARGGYPSFMRALLWSSLLVLAACGGGGGGGSVDVRNPVRLAAAKVEIGGASTGGELAVTLPGAPAGDPALLELTVELPAALQLATNPLHADRTLPTLDGNLVDGKFVVVCGDAHNKAAAALTAGGLFRLGFLCTTPRQVGTHSIRLAVRRAAANDGTVVPVDPNPVLVDVVVR